MNSAAPGGILVASLNGTERVIIGPAVGANAGPQILEATTQMIADLASLVSNNAVLTAINTVGAGILTAAGFIGGSISRGGAQAATAFSDTTDTAAAIIAALPAGALVGTSFYVTIDNNTDGDETIVGGVGVTVSVNTIIPKLTWAQFLVTYSAAATITMAFVAGGAVSPLPPAVFNTTALELTTLTVGTLCGAQIVNLINTGTTPSNLNVPTAAAIIAAIPNAKVGMTYMLNFRNGSGSANTATLTTNTGVTLTGTMTIAQNVTRTFQVTVTSLTTVTIQSMGVSAAAA